MNAIARICLVRGSKVAEKQTQKPDRYLKAPKGAPRNTPRKKVVLDENIFNNLELYLLFLVDKNIILRKLFNYRFLLVECLV